VTLLLLRRNGTIGEKARHEGNLKGEWEGRCNPVYGVEGDRTG
jgi:hypothetical protein